MTFRCFLIDLQMSLAVFSVWFTIVFGFIRNIINICHILTVILDDRRCGYSTQNRS